MKTKQYPRKNDSELQYSTYQSKLTAILLIIFEISFQSRKQACKEFGPQPILLLLAT